MVKSVVQLYFGRVIAHFMLGHDLGFGNCGGLGRGNIWRENRHEVETMGKGGGERKMLYYFTCTTPKPPLCLSTKPLSVKHPITMQDGSIKKLVYEVLCSKVMPPLQARLDQECSDTPSLVFTKQA